MSRTPEAAPETPQTAPRRRLPFRRGTTLACVVLLVVISGVVARRWLFGDNPPPAKLPKVSIGTPSADPEPASINEPSDRGETTDQHQLDPALKIARDGLAHLRNDVADYTAVMVKREMVKGTLTGPDRMQMKVRSRKKKDDELLTPLSVYLKFETAPVGREVIWVENQNDGKLTVNEPSVSGLLGRLSLPPDGFLAMQGQRYPIYNIGFEFLVEELIRFGEHDRQYGECDVTINDNVTVEGRPCTLVEVRHPVKRPYFEFHIAKIFIDHELQVPIRFASYSWPAEKGGQPVLLEEYTYLDVKVNVGLTDADFDPDKYGFP